MNLRFASIICLIFSNSFLAAQDCVLKNAHAHNDYKNNRPLQDALSKNFKSIEADVFLIGEELIVAHTRAECKKKNTLQSLYLEPLNDSSKKNGGSVYRNCEATLILLVDIKTDAAKTYRALKKLITPYHSLLTKMEDGTLTEGAVTIILSGNKPYDELSKEKSTYLFLDQSLLSVNEPSPNPFCLMASTKYSKVLTWSSHRGVSYGEAEKLEQLIKKAHEQGKLVRLWASPDDPKAWAEQLSCGVDLINTDKLEELFRFLNQK